MRNVCLAVQAAVLARRVYHIKSLSIRMSFNQVHALSSNCHLGSPREMGRHAGSRRTVSWSIGDEHRGGELWKDVQYKIGARLQTR
jgi:hypothetical protein